MYGRRKAGIVETHKLEIGRGPITWWDALKLSVASSVGSLARRAAGRESQATVAEPGVKRNTVAVSGSESLQEAIDKVIASSTRGREPRRSM